MSFSAFTTGVLGITAQATAIGHISDNVSNSTTIGYKHVNTQFSDLVFNKVTGDSPVIDSNRNMGVLATADFANRKQGTLLKSSSPSSVAITGNGFFPVSKATAFTSATEVDPSTGETVRFQNPTFGDNTTYFTRAGDFSLDSSRRLVNSSGYYLMAVPIAAGTTVTPAQVQAMEPEVFQVDTSDIAAIPTSEVNYMINLPGSALTGKQITTGIGVIDSASEERNFQVVWTKTGVNAWDLTISTEGGTPASFGPVAVTFNNSLLNTMTTADPALTVTAAGAATVTLNVDYGTGPQPIALNMGDFGGGFNPSASSGLTQFNSESTEASNNVITQNGLLGGEFEYVTFAEDGQIVANYTNGRSATRGVVLLGQFAEPDRLDRVDGTAFVVSDTDLSGQVNYGIPGLSGAGSLTGGALEQSTVDVAEQMTKLIVAQQAYGMNSQIITTADQMWSKAIDMKR